MFALTDCHNKGRTPSLQGVKVSATLLLLLNLEQGKRGPWRAGPLHAWERGCCASYLPPCMQASQKQPARHSSLSMLAGQQWICRASDLPLAPPPCSLLPLWPAPFAHEECCGPAPSCVLAPMQKE